MTQLQQLELAHHGDVCVVKLAGDIDIATASRVQAAALDAIRSYPAGSSEVIIDMSAVSFIDSSGLGALVQIRNVSNERNARTSLRGVTPRIARLLRITGLDTVLPTE